MENFWLSFCSSLGSTLGVIAGLSVIPLLFVLFAFPFKGRAKKYVEEYRKNQKKDEQKALEN